jgi:hypothetical protein
MRIMMSQVEFWQTNSGSDIVTNNVHIHMYSIGIIYTPICKLQSVQQNAHEQNLQNIRICNIIQSTSQLPKDLGRDQHLPKFVLIHSNSPPLKLSQSNIVPFRSDS